MQMNLNQMQIHLNQMQMLMLFYNYVFFAFSKCYFANYLVTTINKKN